MKKNETYTVSCVDLTHEGLGVAKVDQFPIFIEDLLPSEEAVIKIIKTTKSYAFGKVVERLTTSVSRVDITDKKGTWVGTMPLQHMSYEAQLAFKTQQVKQVMTKIAKMPNVPVYDTLGATQTTGYRNKAQIPVRLHEGQLETGFFRKNSHTFVPMADFVIQHPEIDTLILSVRNSLRKHGVRPYDEQTHQGNMRHIMVRRANATGEMQVVLITKDSKRVSDDLIQSIVSSNPKVCSIVQNINTKRTNVIMGDKVLSLYGEDRLTDRLFDLQLTMTSRSFYQVNPEQMAVLYQQAIDAANLDAEDIVIDAYCGIGSIGLSLAKGVKHVYGMEIVPDAIVMAKENARINGITNATFETGSAEEILPKWQKEGVQPTVLIVDPPRKGLAESFIDTSAQMAIPKIVYVSCNPATMARDLARYHQHGYTVSYVQPVDMFPMTNHVEAVVLLTRS